MQKLVRDKAIRAINAVIATQDNDLLQCIYQDETLGEIIDQISIFKLWHGFLKVEDLSNAVLIGLVDFLHLEDPSLFEYVDYTYLFQEYLDTIKNDNTRYLTKQRLLAVVHKASILFQKDLPEISRNEAMDTMEAMLDDASPTTVYRNILCASAFTDWCIKYQKYPDAQNNFKNLSKPTVESWVKKKFVKDALDLALKVRAVLPLNEGYAGPVILALAWMGFAKQEILELKNEDIELLNKKVCGISIPDPLWDIFLQYDGGVHVAPCGSNLLEWCQEDLGYYLKRMIRTPSGKPFDMEAMRRALVMTQYTFDNIALSRRLYDAYQTEKQEGKPPSESQLAAWLGVSVATVKNRYLAIYNVYKSLFWENA